MQSCSINSSSVFAAADKTLFHKKEAFYGIHDRGIGGLQPDRLVKQSFVGGIRADGRVTKTKLVVNYRSKFGWYIPLPDVGERVVSDAIVRHFETGDSLILFNSLVPNPSICADGGHGWEMAVMLHNGGSPREAMWDFGEDGIGGVDDYHMTKKEEKLAYAGRKLVGKGMPAGAAMFGDRRYTPASGGAGTEKIKTTEFKKTGSSQPSGRLSWMELRPRPM